MPDSVRLCMKRELTDEDIEEAVKAGDCEDTAQSIADMLANEMLEEKAREGEDKDVHWSIRVERHKVVGIRRGTIKGKETPDDAA